jgi:hypothetical protein
VTLSERLSLAAVIVGLFSLGLGLYTFGLQRGLSTCLVVP